MPLTQHAVLSPRERSTLRWLAYGPRPVAQTRPRTIDKLVTWGLARRVQEGRRWLVELTPEGHLILAYGPEARAA